MNRSNKRALRLNKACRCQVQPGVVFGAPAQNVGIAVDHEYPEIRAC